MHNTMEPTLGSNPTVHVAPRMALLFNGLSIAAVTLATILPMAAALYWFFIDPVEVRTMVGLAPELLPDITMAQRIAVAVVAMMTTLPLAWGLARLRNCLKCFAAGRPFASEGIAGLRDFATGGMLAALAQLAGHTLTALVLSWTAAEGHRQLAIAIDSQTLLLAMFAGTIAAVGWAMEKAAAIAEENGQFV
jgi:hypothetical protein